MDTVPRVAKAAPVVVRLVPGAVVVVVVVLVVVLGRRDQHC
jgi:hypothetical protein